MITVSTDEVCAAIKDAFTDIRVVLEPAGALAIGTHTHTQRERDRQRDRWMDGWLCVCWFSWHEELR